MYPLAAIMRALPGVNTKHAFSLMVGVASVQWIFEGDWIHSFVSSSGTYLICLAAPRKYLAVIAFAWVMFYMTMTHWYRMYTSYMSGELDHTGTQMVLTMKLTTFAYNFWDGTHDRENVFDPKLDNKQPNTRMKQKMAIKCLPSPLEFFGYVYCFTCVLVGPAFEYNDYVDGLEDYASLQPYKDAIVKESTLDGDKVDCKKKPPIPSPFVPALKSLGVGLVCLILKKGWGDNYYPLHSGKENGHIIPYLSSSIFIVSHPNLLHRIFVIMLVMLVERWKYYFVWKVAEGSCQLAGFGFEGFDEKNNPKGWNGVCNIDIWTFESSWNAQVMTEAWNKRTAHWLRYYTYVRSNDSLVITYFVSAFWHGLYPGFYALFMSMPLVTMVERAARERLNPVLIPKYDRKRPDTYPYDFKGIMYCVVGWLSFKPLMNYLVSTFALGSLDNVLRATNAFYHLPHILLAVVYGMLLMLPKPKMKQR